MSYIIVKNKNGTRYKLTSFDSFEESENDLDDIITPVFHAFTNNDPVPALDRGVLKLIESLRFDGKLVYPDGILPEDPSSLEERAKVNEIWAAITTTYMAPFLYQAYGDKLLNAMRNHCAVKCRYDVCQN